MLKKQVLVRSFIHFEEDNFVVFVFRRIFKAIHFSWLGPELLVCCLANRGSTGVFHLLRS